ncbi:OmpA family protein [Flaviaesturariibacter amylovorans]|uniref:OmpA-like domain-containing protein n=1 Tax=Flaviaesturariibacter amylovorans TaxID=1084520 RepID=A0ABP8GN19_9BACT
MRALLLILLLLSQRAVAQSLLLNGGFEEPNICAEYRVHCAPEAWLYTIPSFDYYYIGAGRAHGGERFIAVVAGNYEKPYFRTFVRSRLLCAMRRGKTYRLQFFVKSPYPTMIDSLGVSFRADDPLFDKQPFPERTPSVFFRDARERAARIDSNWQRITIDYVARGDEAFLAFGNFRRGDWRYPSHPAIQHHNFFFIDDVTLLPLDPVERLCTDWRRRAAGVYEEDERHEYLQRRIKDNSELPPKPVELPPTKILHVDTLEVPDVLFATNSWELNKRALLALDSFMRKQQAFVLDSVVVEGHTDSLGTEEWNLELSANRAQAVATYLQYSIEVPVAARGFGRSRPIADNRTPQGRRRNRRVDIYVFIR